MSFRILLIEDEPGLVLTISDLLASDGYVIEAAGDGPTGLAKALAARYDLIILDVMLPGMSGFEVCRAIRRQGREVAILILTAKTQVADRVVGLKLGADDYLTKPFDPSELQARVEALLRRAPRLQRPPSLARFEFGDVRVDFDRAETLRGGEPVNLAGRELQLLRYLIENRGRVVSRDELLKHVWEYQTEVSTRTVDVHIALLRQKLEGNPQNPKHILTVRGSGYRFDS